jgi:hypothetical protein
MAAGDAATRSSVTLEASREAHCCLGCRLVQPPTRECVECGAAMVGPIAGLRTLMSYRDMKLVGERDMWMISALLAGGSIVMPFLLPFSLVALGASAVQARRRRRALTEQPIAAIAESRPPLAATAVTVIGPAHPLRGPARRAWDGGTCVAAELAVRWVGGLFLRATAIAPFVVGADGGDIVVDGVVRFAVPSVKHRLVGPLGVTGAEPRLAALGVPAGWRFGGLLGVEEVRAGDVVAVTGVIAEEPVAALAGYRDGGVARVMRGTTAAPVRLETQPFAGAIV